MVAPDTIALSGDAKQGLTALERAGIGEGALLPHEILVDGGTDPDRVAARLRGVDGIHGAVAPDGAAWRRDGAALMEAIPVADSDAGDRTLTAVRDAAHAAGRDVGAGGQPAQDADFIDAVYGSFPLMIAVTAVTTFILLARAFRSLLLPAKGDHPQRPQRRRRVGRAGARLAARLRLRRDLGHPGHRLDPLMDAADDLRLPV